ncbi:MAG: hypothetical protein IPP71_15885 [Bacteroidetes bacterium]|nr:hypothetical protein [Bacteroidota bacterium]
MKIANGFITKLIIFSIAVALIFYFVEPYFTGKSAYANHIFIQLFLIIATLFFHIGLMRAGEKSDSAFIRFFMGATGAKMFLFLIIMMMFGILNKEQAFGFILHFFIYYLLYTTFEVAVIYKKFSGMKRTS